MSRRRPAGDNGAVSPASPPPSQSAYEYGPGSSYLGPGETPGGMAGGGHAPFTEEYSVPAPRGKFPKVVWAGGRPAMLLKLRKRFHPLGVTRLTVGMDVDLATAAVGFKWSWTDRFVGAHLTVDRHVAALTKRFAVDEMRANVDVRAALDLHTRKTLFSLAVRPFPGVVATSPRMDGIALRKRIPVDKRVDVEVFARVQLPEARFSSQNGAPFSLGEGDFVVHLDQVNFRFLLQ